jgi:HAD superfamily hydrolase (TIGR01509 family)
MNHAYTAAIRSYLIEHHLDRFKLESILFDMDGVLFDSMPLHAFAWTKTFNELGFLFTEEEAYLHEGRTGDGTINIVYERELMRPATPSEISRIYDRKSVLFESQPVAPVMPGAKELLDRVKSDGLKRLLVTGSGQKALLTRLESNFPGHFSIDRMVTAYDVTQGKPHPEPYFQGLKKAQGQIENAFVVENAPLGIESAKSAGLFVVAVNTGKLQDDHLLDAGADLLFHGMPALCESWPALLADFQRIKA